MDLVLIILIILVSVGFGMMFYFKNKYEETGSIVYKLLSYLSALIPIFIAASVALGYIIKTYA